LPKICRCLSSVFYEFYRASLRAPLPNHNSSAFFLRMSCCWLLPAPPVLCLPAPTDLQLFSLERFPPRVSLPVLSLLRNFHRELFYLFCFCRRKRHHLPSLPISRFGGTMARFASICPFQPLPNFLLFACSARPASLRNLDHTTMLGDMHSLPFPRAHGEKFFLRQSSRVE
jgi:hypothetical protein